MPKDPNDVGALWRKTNERRDEWFSVSLDLEHLLELTGGATGKINLVAFANTRKGTNANAPDYELKFPRKRTVTKPEPDEEIPF